ncbi:MAG: hypothetical protein J5956_11500 [Ruminococcus sp.]|nr:hypothetical protein [Ruminococcus sp.]
MSFHTVEILDHKNHITKTVIIQSTEPRETIVKAVALKEADRILKETGKTPQETHYEDGFPQITNLPNKKIACVDLHYENYLISVILYNRTEYEIEHKYIKAIKDNESTMGILGILNFQAF